MSGYTVYTYYHLLTDKGLYAWGDNEYGQVENGTSTGVSTPEKVELIDNVTKLITSGFTVYAITDTGQLYAWGDNQYGQVGNGTTYDIYTPYKVRVTK